MKHLFKPSQSKRLKILSILFLVSASLTISSKQGWSQDNNGEPLPGAGYLLELYPNLPLVLAVIAAWFLTCIGLIFWMRQAALRAENTDPTVTWYNYWRFFNWINVGIWLGWLLIAFQYNLKEVIHFLLLPNNAWYEATITIVLYFLPPALLVVLSYGLSHEIFARVRGMEWTRGELLQQGILSQLAQFLPSIFIIVAIDFVLQGNVSLSFAMVAAMVGCQLFFTPLWLKAQDMTLHSLTVGELRDRIFALAQKAGVKLEQVYVLPTGKGQLANAFASKGNIIMLSHYLLKNLNKREVDAVVAHELGHLKHKHVEALGTITVWTIALLIILVVFLGKMIPQLPWWLLVALGYLPVLYFYSRRFEFQADAEAVTLSEDPQACITSLQKVTRLNLLPMEWGKLDEQLLSHPSTFKRAQAIATKGNISQQQLEEILYTPETKGEYYALPSEVMSEEKVFSSTFKQQINLRLVLTLLGVRFLTPTLVALSIKLMSWDGLLLYGVYGFGLILTIVVDLLALNFAPVWGQSYLQQKLKVKLEREGMAVDEWGGIFVSFAPDREPRSYEGFQEWDVGFLFLKGNRLFYIGEQTRFSLAADEITAVYLGAGFPVWWTSPLLYISWYNEEEDTKGIFNLTPADVSSLGEIKGKVKLLKRKVDTLLEQNCEETAKPVQLRELSHPSKIGNITSNSLEEVYKKIKLFSEFLLNGLMAMGIGAVLQLSFLSIVYVVFVAFGTTVFQLIPYWRAPKGSLREIG